VQQLWSVVFHNPPPMSRAPRNSPITEQQWEHIFGILEGACYGSNAVQVAW
jgi:hypothetical protein